MSQLDISIKSDITKASTIHSDFYTHAELYELSKDKIFASSWQCLGLKSQLQGPGTVQPFNYMPGFLDEPLILVKDKEDTLRCLSNVCTHRGFLLVGEAGSCSEIRCRYHGKRYGLDGKFKSMPQFKEAKDFPSEADNLPELPLHFLGDMIFAAIDPKVSFESWVGPMMERVNFMPFDEFVHSPEYSQAYEIDAHWALYCDNYLEGFHIPFVHPSLNDIVSFPDYTYETFDHGSLQVGIAKEGSPYFDLPKGHPDEGKKVAAYWYWLFPNIMFNLFPWGLSLNLIMPKGLTKTEIRFETFLWKPELFNEFEQERLHMTEMEDEAVVEAVQKGVSSRLYQKGRFSPKQEVAVHHFHKLIAKSMKSNNVKAQKQNVPLKHG